LFISGDGLGQHVGLQTSVVNKGHLPFTILMIVGNIMES